MIEVLAQLTEKHAVTGRYLVGVSGGLDSVVLLHGLHRVGYRRLVVVHFNHGLRGRSSGADAAFVRRLAASLDYPVECERGEVARLAAKAKLSLETAAREARYAFFARVARRRRCGTLFLGHHADDQVETVVMNFFRGSGGGGVGGMREDSERRIDGVTLRLLRPLLAVRRSALEAYAEAEGLRFRQDASNEDAGFLRNRVRHELLPASEALFRRDVSGAVLRLAEQTREEHAYLESLVAEAAGEPRLAVRQVREMPRALQRRLLHRWLRNQKVPDVGFALVEAARELVIPGARTAKLNLPGGGHLRRRQGVLFIERPGRIEAR